MTDQIDTPSADTPAQDGADQGLDRRLFFFKTLLGAATIATAASVTTSTPAEAQRLRVTDSDPYDREGRGRGRYVRRRGTDADPYDAEGRGRVRVYRRRVRVTDNDPRDPRGGAIVVVDADDDGAGSCCAGCLQDVEPRALAVIDLEAEGAGGLDHLDIVLNDREIEAARQQSLAGDMRETAEADHQDIAA